MMRPQMMTSVVWSLRLVGTDTGAKCILVACFPGGEPFEGVTIPTNGAELLVDSVSPAWTAATALAARSFSLRLGWRCSSGIVRAAPLLLLMIQPARAWERVLVTL